MLSEKIFQVSEFNEFINNYLGEIGEVIIEGEIGDIQIRQEKWLFMTLKDQQASLEVFGLCFKIPGFDLLQPGMMVYVYGYPRLYQKTGRFSVFATQIVPAGEGALKIAFEKLKEKLANEGFFDEQRKRPLPLFPQNIGLITAKKSRAFGDFIKVLSCRMGGLKIYFYPVSVQGDGSVEAIVNAFKYFNTTFPFLDVIVLIRGGGSLEDLQSFNDERVARAIFSSKIPVLCGIGHEDDETIADLVADVRASTPSNAAELLVRDRKEVLNEINNKVKAIYSHFLYLIKENRSSINKRIVFLENFLERQIAFVHTLTVRFSNQFILLTQKIKNLKNTNFNFQKRLGQAFNFYFSRKKTKLINLFRVLKTFDIKKTLKRGFSITFDSQGKILKNIKMVAENSSIITRLFDGKINSKVIKVLKPKQ